MPVQFLGLPPASLVQGAARTGAAQTAGAGPATAGANLSFSAFLDRALASVEADQKQAAAAAVSLASGQAPDLAAVMLASEKATLSLQLAISVRNKVLEAYQEIMRMPL